MGKGLVPTRSELFLPRWAFLCNNSLHVCNPQWCRSQGIMVKASCSGNSTRSISLIHDGDLRLSRKSSRNISIVDTFAKPFPKIGYILDAYEDEYEGVIVNPERIPWNASDFDFSLRASLSHWRSKGKKGVWLKLPLERSDLVPYAVKVGFKYHHAEQEYVMLIYWLPESPNMLPANASHSVGIGGFVINAKNEVLVVQERYSVAASTYEWKLPTGFIHENEEIYDGAVREVKEETGIHTEFVEIIAFRHAHSVAFRKSDLFFICMLKPLSTQIQIDDSEIQAAKWMPLADFLRQPFVREDSMFKKVIGICIERLGERYCGLSAHSVLSKFDGKFSSLYYNISSQKDFNCQEC